MSHTSPATPSAWRPASPLDSVHFACVNYLSPLGVSLPDSCTLLLVSNTASLVLDSIVSGGPNPDYPACLPPDVQPSFLRLV